MLKGINENKNLIRYRYVILNIIRFFSQILFMHDNVSINKRMDDNLYFNQEYITSYFQYLSYRNLKKKKKINFNIRSTTTS